MAALLRGYFDYMGLSISRDEDEDEDEVTVQPDGLEEDPFDTILVNVHLWLFILSRLT